jgi:hypothetical protein
VLLSRFSVLPPQQRHLADVLCSELYTVGNSFSRAAMTLRDPALSLLLIPEPTMRMGCPRPVTPASVWVLIQRTTL